MLVLRPAVALTATAVALLGATAPAGAQSGRCAGGKTVEETRDVRVSRTGGGVVRACWKPTGHRERLGTDAPDHRITGVRVDGSRVRFVLRHLQPDAQYDFERVVDARTSADVSARYLPYGTG